MGVERLVIHIGAHKAGSTALQLFLAENRAAFADRGVTIPRAGADPECGHHSNIAWESLRPDLFDPGLGTLSDLVEELGSLDIGLAVISSEEFELLPSREAVDAFLDPLRAVAAHIELLVYVRPQFHYAASAYSEALKAGNIGYFNDFYAQAVCWSRLDYDRYFTKWEGHRDTRLHVRPMTVELRARGIGADLLDLLKIGDRQGFDPGIARNVSLGPEVVYALLYAKFRSAYRGPALDRAICTAIRRKVAVLTPKARRYSALTEAQVAWCEKLHRKGNAAFMARNGLPAWEQVFADEIATAGRVECTDVALDLQKQIEASVDSILETPSHRLSA